MEPLVPRQGNYRRLISYRKAEAIYDLTCYFCDTYLRRGDRTVDQMIQAARSGKQNIVEGSAASSTGRETEIKLVGVAKASLQELLVDYEDYLRTRGLIQWVDDSPELTVARELGREHNDSAFWLDRVRGDDVLTANTAIVLIRQTDYLLFRQLERLGEQFLDEGGFRERMTRLRRERRGY